MTPRELEAYDAMMKDRDKWREKSEKMEAVNVRLTRALEAIDAIYIDGCKTYVDWKSMGDIARTVLDSQNDPVEARREKTPPQQ